jgi:hypothetical protein
MQEMLNVIEDQNICERIYNDGWEKICRKDYLKYVKLAFESLLHTSRYSVFGMFLNLACVHVHVH